MQQQPMQQLQLPFTAIIAVSLTSGLVAASATCLLLRKTARKQSLLPPDCAHKVQHAQGCCASAHGSNALQTQQEATTEIHEPRRQLFASPAPHPLKTPSHRQHGRDVHTQPCTPSAQMQHIEQQSGVERRRVDAEDPSPRTGYLQWDDYFMALAFLSAERSKDPNKQVGAVIVDAHNVILGIGYNGFPRGCSDGDLPWSKTSQQGKLHTKYPYVVHAEANALLNKNAASVEGARVYVTMFPCNECAKLLIQAGIKEVVYHEAKVEEQVGGGGNSVLPPSKANRSSASGAAGAACCPGTAGPCATPSAAAAPPTVSRSQEVDPCYIASNRLLNLAGVRLRQHQLRRLVVLPPAV